MLHTHLTNRVAAWLIEQGKIPGLKGYTIVRPEVPVGRSRFDFLLQKQKKELLLEVKSCTLFSKEIAMFPDAITERGRKHVIELADLSQKGVQGALLFVVHWPHARFFLPEYHTDLAFARTLLKLKDQLLIHAVAIEWQKDLTLGPAVHPLEIPWNLVEQEAHDSGSYILVLYLKKDRRIRIGQLGEVPFDKGYYLYVGSARKNLGKRIERHRRRRKKLFWHIDYLREHAEFCTALPVRTGASLECKMAREMNEISHWPVPGFGASDCECSTHLFGFRSDPLKTSSFINAVQYFRMGRLRSQNLS
jgi:sugar fermentation stimulation protein A